MEEWAAVLGKLRFREVLENMPAGRGVDGLCLTLLLLSI